ncbi:hypothetical protein EMIHUDRAFT_354643 [Emiliania huxleyi CCMP1516]|uniref:Inosine/uridine-preferring nucleoside hydrolase domain-containing protein n=2 Tax=Emiliania huxleyi TaxID=2903 RepID=A0A0D3JKS2_EMIH1|nr:hypothetical protein EMIHUDRAFT_354643 [Emiliania huxleyi CCMP1516]EOD24107.1 hypothetical protein EMIHUDRAFT_354643 [Emiliania huxleyi CCMP1516]|eukprot:XP_005776536.1 hypothetical protein EMIHUDRAFT_354643 [Emiliania huxleyi CCMP1516]
MIMKFALLLGYTAAALGMSMPTKDALPARATTFASLDLPEHDAFKPTINECGSSSRIPVIWETDAHVDDVTVAILLAKSEKYKLDTMIISGTGDATNSLIGGNNFLRLLSLLGMHDVKVGLSKPEPTKEYTPLSRAADMLAGVIEDLPYYPMHVNELNGSANYGVDAYDLSKRVPECTPATCKGPIDATWITRPTSTKYYKEALDRGVTTVFVTGTLSALNDVLHSDANNIINLTKGPTVHGQSYLNNITNMTMMMGNYWKQIYSPIQHPEVYQAASKDCEASCTFDWETGGWMADCDGPPICDYTPPEGNAHAFTNFSATKNVLGALRHPDIVIKTAPWSTTNWVGNCPDKDYLEEMNMQMNKEVGTKESQLVLDMMNNLVNDATQYNWGGFLTGGYCFYDQLGYYTLVEPDAFTWKTEDVYVQPDATFLPANMEEGPDKKYTATIQFATITNTSAYHFRDEFMPGELTKRCIHHQPPSFKELQQFYDFEKYGRTCHGDDDN